ncbi:MAG: prolyl oligopeptidase family serine peptidase, partial [Candidatus Eremiobacteraeota bacterium]|nr:prolyl oligopeptidase family serine peptidase [Candidatus Eremiobacteraeota bacterium]
DKFSSGGVPAAISWFTPSDDGSKVAFGIAPGGSEDAVGHVIETASGRVLPDAIDRARFGATAWRADGRAFYYARLQVVPAGAPPTAKYQNVRTYRHVLGEDPTKDVAVWGAGVDPSVTVDPNAFAFAGVSPESSWAYGFLINGVQRELTIYYAPKSGFDGGKAAWKKLVDPADGVTDAAVHANQIFLLSHQNAPRFKVLEVDLPGGTLANAKTVVAPSARVVEALSPAKDALYVQSLEDGLGRMTRLAYSDMKPADVPLPVNGTLSNLTTEPDETGFLAKLEGWTIPALWYAYDPATNRVVDTKLDPPSPVDYSNITSEEVKVKGRDGVMIPLSIVHRKDMKKDSSNPTLLYAYGSYGINSNPSFSPVRLTWFERGGVYAIAHVRGGGEYGEEWHLAGKDTNKINTVNDFVDCAKWLIDQKYTSPGKLGGRGGSAGGITMGGAITQAPELFAAILDEVPVSDQLRIEFTANGPPNIPEFGSVKTEGGFKNLYATSAVQHVRPGAKYPAVMLTTGVNDPRVDPWQAAKMAATLQADNTSGKPILLRVEYEGGHGIGSTKEQSEQLVADEYAFLLWNMGVGGFQPTI